MDKEQKFCNPKHISVFSFQLVHASMHTSKQLVHTDKSAKNRASCDALTCSNLHAKTWREKTGKRV